jgi:hypothetical protein
VGFFGVQRDGLKSATNFFLVALRLQRERVFVAAVVAPCCSLVAFLGIKKEPFLRVKNQLLIYDLTNIYFYGKMYQLFL